MTVRKAVDFRGTEGKGSEKGCAKRKGGGESEAGTKLAKMKAERRKEESTGKGYYSDLAGERVYGIGSIRAVQTDVRLAAFD